MATSSEETRYRYLLQELAGDLTSEEVRGLVFLLRLHIKGKKRRSDIKSDATKLLIELENSNCIRIDNLSLLVELFELIGRTDLKNKIVEKQGHICQVSGPEPNINQFMRILWKFGQNLDSGDLKNAKFILGWTRDKDIENVWQMFDKAFEIGDLVENNENSVRKFAEKINQIERLRSVRNEYPVMYPSSNYTPGITLTPDLSQQEYLYTRDDITPREEEIHWSPEQPWPHWPPEQPWPHWPPEQPQPENNLSRYSPYFGINQRLSPSNNQYFQQISVPHEDDMSIPPLAAFGNSHVARYLPASNTGAKTDPNDLVKEPLEKYQRQDASARLKDGGHEANLKDINASVKLLEPQSPLEEIMEGNKSQNEMKEAREMSVTGSSSANVNLTSGQTVPAGTQFKGEIGICHLNTNEDPVSKGDKQKESKDIQTGSGYQEAILFRERVNKYDKVAFSGDQNAETETRKFRGTLQDVINVEPKSEQASKRSEQKEASQEIRSSGWDEKQMSELNVSGSHLDIPNETKENKSIQNEVIYVRDPGSLGVTSHLLINNQNEASPGIKMDITEDLKDIREMPNTNQSPSVENLTLGQTVQTEKGSFIGPDDAAPTPIFNLDSTSNGASQIAEQKEARHEIISSTLIEEKISKLNLSKESNASLNETRENNDLIISEHVDITYVQNEKRMPGNMIQSNNDATSKSKQDSVEQTSTSDENSHIGNGREGYSSFGTSLFSSSPARTSESGGDANGKQEAIDGKSTDPGNLEHSQEMQGRGDSRILESSGIFPTTRKQSVCSPNYPRYGQIITMTVEEMTSYKGKQIGEGAFGTVYKAKIPKEEKCKFVIKEIKVTEELYQKSYDMEIHHGRILHPFINPIVARAESLPTKSEKGVCYLMYPYMKNRELRCNIDKVNEGNNLCLREPNAKIWSRCIYQIVQAVDFLHKPAGSVRGPIFHRDLTSRNIFLDENFNVRIGDFGIAVEAKLNATKATMTKALGTEGYHPPNMNMSKYNASYDVFSVGVVMLEILTGLEARLEEDPFYLYRKYNCEDGYKDLIEDLDMKAEENEAASWSNEDHRNKFAEIALQAVEVDEEQRKMVNLLQKLEDMRLNSRERYQKPENQDRCVSCGVNPKAKLSTKGQKCLGNERNNPCQHFCVLCLMNHHFNPIVCPQHGKTRPPFGDHVYAVFVAGNNVDNTQQYPGRKGPSHDSEVAQMFVRDVQKVVQVLTAKHPFVLGASKENVRVVKPEKPGTKDKMEAKIKQAFEELNAAIKQAIQMENLDPKKDRLPNSLFIFYFSGHCSTEEGLYLGSTEESLKASTLWIQEMLHKELGVDQIVVVLDCCHANSQNFTDTHGLNAVADFKDVRKKASIVQLSSCDIDEKSSAKFEKEGHGSYFTHFFCQGLLGLDSVMLENDTVMFCDECEKDRKDQNAVDITVPCGKYHNQCLSDHGVTFYALKNFIQGHFQHLRSNTSGPEFMTQVHNAQGEKEVFLAYYNPFKWHIPIHLKGSDVFHNFCLNSDTDSMDKLRQDIIKHSVETKLHSDVLKFHESYESTEKDSSHLIAIHPRYGSDRDSELISLDSIYKARSCSRELEARVRENIKAISNGPVKLSKINSTVVINYGLEINDDHLKICQRYIQVAIKSLTNVEDYLRKMKQSPSQHKDIKTLIQEVLQVLRSIRTLNNGSLLEKEKEKVLRIYLYKEFSILAVEAI